ncbi:MAG: hypothetical protein ACK478_04210 [Flavobacteriales bacterium]|jgi:hypothetical protein
MLVVFGLNKDIWNQLCAPERAQYTWAARLYLLSCLLSAAAGMRFMQQLSDSYIIGILGGLMVGYIVSVVTRIALITMVSLPIHPVFNSVQAAPINTAQTAALDSAGAPVPSNQPTSASLGHTKILNQNWGQLLSILFRMFIIALMSLVVALPIAALLGYYQAENISNVRRAEVLSEFKANHPDMDREQHRILLSNLEADHFPIHVYRELAQQPVGLFSIWLSGACFLIPFFMLWHLRSGKQFHYATLNRDRLVHQIETDYAMTLEQSRSIQQRRYGLTESVMPNQAWLDPPFNTRSIAEQTPYTLETEVVFVERLKTL